MVLTDNFKTILRYGHQNRLKKLEIKLQRSKNADFKSKNFEWDDFKMKVRINKKEKLINWLICFIDSQSFLCHLK